MTDIEMSPAEYKRFLTIAAECDQLLAVNAELVALVKLMDGRGLRACSIKAPEDVEVEALCERVGYGAVMDAAARLWWQKDECGAFVVGPCAVMVRDAIAAAEATP